MKKKTLIITAAALLMLGAVAVKPAMAYFTDTHSAEGTVRFGKYEITPHERVNGFEKTIWVENTGDYPVYARVKVFAGSTHPLTYETENTGWELKADGFYYFNQIIEPKKTSNQMKVKIDPNGDKGEEFNVIVIEEAAKVKADGTAAWDEKSVNEEIYTANGGGQ